MKITVATLTVDDGNMTLTSVHPTMADAEKCLFDNYDFDNQFDGDMQELLDRTGITAYFDTSTIDVPVEVTTVTSSTGLVYKPWSMGAMVGYEMTHPSGVVNYIYFNPTAHSDDGVDNVFVYYGTAGEPHEDEAITHLEVDTYPEVTP